jgi:hypothetical protein
LQIAEIATVKPQQVEGAEASGSTMEEQIVELRTAVLVKADDLAIEDGVP